jgi:hypothetical protein
MKDATKEWMADTAETAARKFVELLGQVSWVWPNWIWEQVRSRPAKGALGALGPALMPWMLVSFFVWYCTLDLASCGARRSPIPPVRKTYVAMVAAQTSAHQMLADVRDRWHETPLLLAAEVTPYKWLQWPLSAPIGVGLLSLVLFLTSTLLLGPVHLAIRPGSAAGDSTWTVGGKRLKKVSASGMAGARRKAQRRSTWFLGKSRTTGKPLFFGKERLQHTWVVGGTGTGKTVSVVLSAIRADILAGRPVVFIDGKGDMGVADQVYSYAAEAGRADAFRFLHLAAPKRSCTYSPLLHGTATEKKDKLIAAFEWTEGHYRKRCEEVALHVLAALEATKKPYCLEDLRLALGNINAFRELSSAQTDERIRRNLRAIADRWNEVQESTVGLRTDLGLITETEVGGLFRTYKPEIDFWTAYNTGHIVYVGLPTMLYQATAVRLARMMLGDLKTVAARVQTERRAVGDKHMLVAVDEFASFAFEEFAELINKARSAGIALLLSHQSMRGDLERAGEFFFRQVQSNTNIKICLRQDSPDDAEEMAKCGGTYTTVKRTEQVEQSLLMSARTGMGSAREVEEYMVHPNQIKALPMGQAAVICSDPRRVDIVQLDYPSPVTTVPLQLATRRHPEAAPDGGVCLWKHCREADEKPRHAADNKRAVAALAVPAKAPVNERSTPEIHDTVIDPQHQQQQLRQSAGRPGERGDTYGGSLVVSLRPQQPAEVNRADGRHGGDLRRVDTDGRQATQTFEERRREQEREQSVVAANKRSGSLHDLRRRDT